MPRFFVTGAPSGLYFLGGEEGRHGAKALRLRPGEAVTLCNGQGVDFPGLVERVEPDGLWLRLEEGRPCLAEPRANVTVCQCLPKGDKLDTVVQKSVELGAKALWLVESARCVARFDPKQAEKKTARLQRIALEAAKQSGRGIVPMVRPPMAFQQAIQAAAKAGAVLFFYEKGRHSLKQALDAAGEELFLFVGPEGGFSPEEAALAESLGALPLTLGRRILRTETAPIAALSAIFFHRGDMEIYG